MRNLEAVGNPKSTVTRVYDEILRVITEDNMVGGKFPPEVELAKQLGVSRTALREALQRLESEGYISRRRRIGTTVLARRLNLDAGLEQLNSITQTIVSAGMKPGTILRRWRRESANGLIAKMLEIDVGDEVAVMDRVRTADDIPFCYDINFFPVGRITEDEDSSIGESLLQYLTKKHGGANHALAYLHPCLADEMVSEKLKVPVDHLLMLMEHTHYAPDGQPMWYSRTFHRSDVISFHIVRKVEADH